MLSQGPQSIFTQSPTKSKKRAKQWRKRQVQGDDLTMTINCSLARRPWATETTRGSEGAAPGKIGMSTGPLQTPQWPSIRHEIGGQASTWGWSLHTSSSVRLGHQPSLHSTMMTKHLPDERWPSIHLRTKASDPRRVHPVGSGHRLGLHNTAMVKHPQENSGQVPTWGLSLHTSRWLPWSDWDINRVSIIPWQYSIHHTKRTLAKHLSSTSASTMSQPAEDNRDDDQQWSGSDDGDGDQRRKGDDNHGDSNNSPRHCKTRIAQEDR
jgi:hypothetical protein